MIMQWKVQYCAIQMQYLEPRQSLTSSSHRQSKPSRSITLLGALHVRVCCYSGITTLGQLE